MFRVQGSGFGVQGLLVLMLIGPVRSGLALGPHELLVLANRTSSESVGVATEYARLRRIPAANVVMLDLPARGGIEISPADFTSLIWEPACRAARERQIDDHVLAWVYSVDFPTRIRADPPLSIQGLTFLRNRMPDGETVAKAIYVSPLFAGPDGPRGPGFPSQTLDSPGAWMGKDMPLPSMMLGFLGLRGNTRDEIGACLRRGVQADGTAPEGTVYFVTNTNIRSLARGWEFAPVVRELRELGVRAIVTNALPGGEQEVLGLVTGSASVDTTTPRRFLPGAMAEHLTSFGAAFDTGDQTKITEWIRAGATASAGTVTEPMALWPKFPHARFFTHLASGCTTLESFYLSLRCPLQTLLVGDPLAAPWAPVSRISLQGIDTGRLRDRTTVTAVVQARHGEMFNRYLFLMDGKIVQEAGKTPTASIDPAALAAGPHALRVVAYRVGTVRGQIFTELAFTVDRK